MLEEEQVVNFSCETCAEQMASDAGLAFHLKYKMCRYKCNFCERKFVIKEEVTQHEKQTHEEPDTNNGNKTHERTVNGHKNRFHEGTVTDHEIQTQYVPITNHDNQRHKGNVTDYENQTNNGAVIDYENQTNNGAVNHENKTHKGIATNQEKHTHMSTATETRIKTPEEETVTKQENQTHKKAIIDSENQTHKDTFNDHDIEIIEGTITQMKGVSSKVEDFTNTSNIFSKRKNDFEEWKQDPLLPEGWKILKAVINGKQKDHFQSPTGEIFSSRDNVNRFMKRNSIYANHEDVSEVCTKTKFLYKSSFRSIQHPVETNGEEVNPKNLLISKDSTSNNPKKNSSSMAKSGNIKTEADNWIENDPTVPPGWKIRTESSAGGHFMQRRSTKRESFLSPNGKMFPSRSSLLDHLLRDKNSTAHDINIVEKAMGEPAVPWNTGSKDVPEGWKTKTMKGRRMFTSPSGEVFLGRVAVLEHLVAVGAAVEDVIKVEKEVIGTRRLEPFWCRDKEFPDGWMVRPVCGLGQSKQKSFYKSPEGQVFLGIDKASESEEIKSSKLNNKGLLLDLQEASKIDSEYSTMNVDVIPSRKSSPKVSSSAESNARGEDSDVISLSDDELDVFLENEQQEVVPSKHSSCCITEIEVTDDQEERNGTFSTKQLEILELAYNQWPCPFSNLVYQLSNETGIKPELIVEWFWKKNETKVEECKNNLAKDINTDKDQSMTKDQITLSMSSKDRASKVDFKMNSTQSKRRLPADTLKLLTSSFKLDPECPNGEKLDSLEAMTGMSRVAIKRWFSNRRWRLANRNDALPMERHESVTKSKKVPFAKKGTKRSSKRDQHHWIQDPTLPQNWTSCNINGSLMFKSPEGQQYSSRMEVIKSFHSQAT